MAAGLFYVDTEPGSVDEAEFHDWYDHEHGPARRIYEQLSEDGSPVGSPAPVVLAVAIPVPA
jgi:hypothetical protein